MRRVCEVIVVEGRYDKAAVKAAVACTVIETSGFGIFSDAEKLALIRTLARSRGLILLTDADSAGFLIRGHLGGMIDGRVKHAYIPDVYGRERRKRAPSKEGKLGVEGMTRQVILAALERAGATFEDEPAAPESGGSITKADMYEAGLSGGAYSARKREALCRIAGLPSKIPANSLLDVLNALYTRDEFISLCAQLCGP